MNNAHQTPDIVVMGASLGGLSAITDVLSRLPGDFSVPIAFVQHRGAHDPDMLIHILRRMTPIPVREPHDKEQIQPGRFYVAPADYHLIVEKGAFSLSTEHAVSYARPSIDVLFETAAEAYGPGVIGVLMTGANHDGANGARRIKECGGRLIVQDPSTAESNVMPRAAIEATTVDRILPLERIAGTLVEWCGNETAHAGSRSMIENG